MDFLTHCRIHVPTICSLSKRNIFQQCLNCQLIINKYPLFQCQKLSFTDIRSQKQPSVLHVVDSTAAMSYQPISNPHRITSQVAGILLINEGRTFTTSLFHSLQMLSRFFQQPGQGSTLFFLMMNLTLLLMSSSQIALHFSQFTLCLV